MDEVQRGVSKNITQYLFLKRNEQFLSGSDLEVRFKLKLVFFPTKLVLGLHIISKNEKLKISVPSNS